MLIESPKSRMVGEVPPTLGGQTVIVVDDEPLVRVVLSRVLRLAGAEVHEAAGYDAACELLSGGVRCDVLITDHHMAGNGGPELLAWVRARWPALPVILVTGNPEAQHTGGFDLVLAKPVPGARLVAAVAGVLDVKSGPPGDA